MTRIALYPWTGRGAALTGVLLLLVLEATAMGTAPAGLRSFLGGVLLGSSTAGLVVALLLARTLHRTLALPANDDTRWYTARTLDGFPMEQVRPLLLASGGPGLNRLYTAWVFATHGHEAPWIARHLDLPVPTARLLVDAARRHSSPAADTAHPND
ncbi:hypothetical protein [Kitasatospora sp. CB01950]|uniref:hypothetical protein n=1 Tax=Kitasatospora sp. CB01950 TaxID=1703930 RepID=UPI00093AC5EA|nr:hypothetical protein [Kitasatospora sp. CB01950]